MPRECPDWDALAPYCEHFESGGLNRSILAILEPLLHPPLLYVGSGRGTLPAQLAQRFGRAAVRSVDRSVAMCRRARHESGLDCVAAEAASLPFPDGSFATVLCATGVLEYVERHECVAALAGMARVCGSSGQVLVSAACSDGDVRWDADQHRLVEAWYERRFDNAPKSARAFDALASALGGRDAARELLLESLPRFGRAIATEDLAAVARRAGLEIAASGINHDGIGVWRLVHASGKPAE